MLKSALIRAFPSKRLESRERTFAEIKTLLIARPAVFISISPVVLRAVFRSFATGACPPSAAHIGAPRGFYLFADIALIAHSSAFVLRLVLSGRADLYARYTFAFSVPPSRSVVPPWLSQSPLSVKKTDQARGAPTHLETHFPLIKK